MDKNEFTCVDDCNEPLIAPFVKNWLIRFDSEDEAANFVIDAFFNETEHVHFLFGEDIYSVTKNDASELTRPHITVYFRTFRIRIENFSIFLVEKIGSDDVTGNDDVIMTSL